jgi:hypothetical protein
MPGRDSRQAAGRQAGSGQHPLAGDAGKLSVPLQHGSCQHLQVTHPLHVAQQAWGGETYLTAHVFIADPCYTRFFAADCPLHLLLGGICTMFALATAVLLGSSYALELHAHALIPSLQIRDAAEQEVAARRKQGEAELRQQLQVVEQRHNAAAALASAAADAAWQQQLAQER